MFHDKRLEILAHSYWLEISPMCACVYVCLYGLVDMRVYIMFCVFVCERECLFMCLCALSLINKEN